MGTVGLMSAERDSHAPVKLSPGHLREHKDYPKLAAIVLERDSLGGKLKMECGSIEAAKRLLPEQFQEYNKLRSQVRASKTRLERLALKDVRNDWFEAVDHDEIKQQLRSEAASTFAFSKPEFDCLVRKAIAEVFSSEKLVEASAWSDTVRALSTLCLQRPKIHTTLREEEENLCPFCFGDGTLQPADRFHSFHSIGTPRRHINRVHSSATTSPGPINCPYVVVCETMMEQCEHLKSRLVTVHGLNL